MVRRRKSVSDDATGLNDRIGAQFSRRYCIRPDRDSGKSRREVVAMMQTAKARH